MTKSNIVLTTAILFVSYFAYQCWQSEKRAIKIADEKTLELANYKKDNNEVKKLSSNLTETIKNVQITTDSLRNDIDNGLIELRVKVETAERNSTTASTTAVKAVRLAKDARQDYYNLTNAISYNKTVIDGWQQYYCSIIAPKNSTEFMCGAVAK